MARIPVRRWIFQTLNADKGDGGLMEMLRKGEKPLRPGQKVSPFKIFHDEASENAHFPFVVISYMSGAGTDENTLGGKRANSDILFQVAVEMEDGTVFDEESAVKRIDALLQGVLKEDAPPRFSSRREGEADGTTFGSALSTRMAGGQYRFLVNGEK